MGWLDRFRGSKVRAASAMEALVRERDAKIFSAVGVDASHARPPLATPSAELAARVVPSFDPLWLHNGVFAFGPTAARPYWLYAPAGLSTPWNTQTTEELAAPSDKLSAVGFELSMATPDFTDRPIRILNVLMLVSLGVWTHRIEGRLIERGERLPLRPMGLQFSDTKLTTLLTTSPPFSPDEFVIASGRARWIHLLGITHEEHQWLEATKDVTLQEAKISELRGLTDFARTTSITK